MQSAISKSSIRINSYSLFLAKNKKRRSEKMKHQNFGFWQKIIIKYLFFGRKIKDENELIFFVFVFGKKYKNICFLVDLSVGHGLGKGNGKWKLRPTSNDATLWRGNVSLPSTHYNENVYAERRKKVLCHIQGAMV